MQAGNRDGHPTLQNQEKWVTVPRRHPGRSLDVLARRGAKMLQLYIHGDKKKNSALRRGEGRLIREEEIKHEKRLSISSKQETSALG